MKKTKIGIIGCGNISEVYIKNLSSLFHNTEVVALSDVYLEKAIEKGKQHNIAKVLPVDELLADPEIEIVLNITPPFAHFDICKKIMQAGKHAFVEKPVSLNTAQGKELLKIAKENNVQLGCAPDTFMGAGLQTAIKAINEGLIGEVVSAEIFDVCHGHENWHPDPEFFYEIGGGPMYDRGPYFLSALIAMIGPAKTVSAMTSKAFKQRKVTSSKKYGKMINVDIPTHVTGNIEFKNGAIANVIMSFDVWGSKLPKIEIHGTLGSLLVPDANSFTGDTYISTYFDKEFKLIPHTFIYDGNSRGLGLSDFAYSVEKGILPRANGKMAVHVLEIMDAFHISAEEKKHVDLTTDCEIPRAMPIGLLTGEIY